ncbi:MAG TPA: cytochrome c [Anaerolineales bacterium]|nr:cytochrome c [Anaerolineales bacterium]
MNLKVTFSLLAAIVLAACSASDKQTSPTLTPQQQQGQAVFNLRCAQCHATVPDTIVIGPSLYGIATRAETRVAGYDAEAYLERSILVPDFYVVEGFTDTMPTNFGKELTSEELSALVSYLMTLK